MTDPVDGAIQITDAFLATFNAHDARGHAETLAYPHVRLASGRVRIWDDVDQATAQMEQGIAALVGSGWHHSVWDHRNVIHVGQTPDGPKVHLDVQFTRYREDGSVIGVFPAVYVIVERDGRSLIQARSSFAP